VSKGKSASSGGTSYGNFMQLMYVINLTQRRKTKTCPGSHVRRSLIPLLPILSKLAAFIIHQVIREYFSTEETLELYYIRLDIILSYFPTTKGLTNLTPVSSVLVT
jgi:hypothetical protein